MGPFEKELRGFHALDWRQCFRDLDVSLATDRTQPSGLEESPPSIITGDPFDLDPGNCILVLGINPGWPSPKIQQIDCKPAQRAWEAGFDEYRLHRRHYFAEAAGKPGHTKKADQRYNGRHFSRSGNFLASALGVAHEGWDAALNARRFFRENAAILDLLPYWSRDTKNLNLAGALQQESVRHWRKVISAFIKEKQPKLVVVNGNGKTNHDLIEGILGCNLSAATRGQILMGRAGTENLETVVLAHPFLSRWKVKRPDAIEQFSAALRASQLSIPLLTKRPRAEELSGLL